MERNCHTCHYDDDGICRHSEGCDTEEFEHWNPSKVALLEDELARYKQEAEKIPDFCKHYNGWYEVCELSEDCRVQICPQICPKWRGGH